MINSSIGKIYVFCPYGLVTGGSEALHQLVFYINKQIKDKAVLIYADIRSKKESIPTSYQQYITTYGLREDINDEENNVLIVPETLWFHLSQYKHVQKYIWWLSVENNTKQAKGDKIKKIFKKLFSIKVWKKIFRGYYSKDKIKDFSKNTPYDFTKEENKIHHLTASYYAYDYVKQNSSNEVSLLIEPISLYYLKQSGYQSKENRKSQVLYNPVKSGTYVNKLKKKAKDISFVALSGFSQEQLLNLYRESKVYIDFGPFPGAERMPKEACYNGCLIITGRNGASNYKEDVSIPEEDKYLSDNESMMKVIDKIHLFFKNYENYQNRDQDYYDKISNLEKNFNKQIKETLLSYK